MSQINDALNKAKQAPPRNTPNVVPPMSPGTTDNASSAVWVIPAIVIFLIIAAIFFIGWAAAHNTVRDITTRPEPAPQEDPIIPPPDNSAAPGQVATASTTPTNSDTNAVAAEPPPMPALQGIFYSDTAPTAILDGKTVSPGDQFKGFKVKTITKFTVTLIGPDQKEYSLGMN